MTSHRVDQPFATLGVGVAIATFMAWILHNALKTGRVNTSRGGASYLYRDANRLKFWTYLFFVFLCFALGVACIFISVESLLA